MLYNIRRGKGYLGDAIAWMSRAESICQHCSHHFLRILQGTWSTRLHPAKYSQSRHLHNKDAGWKRNAENLPGIIIYARPVRGGGHEPEAWKFQPAIVPLLASRVPIQVEMLTHTTFLFSTNPSRQRVRAGATSLCKEALGTHRRRPSTERLSFFCKCF